MEPQKLHACGLARYLNTVSREANRDALFAAILVMEIDDLNPQHLNVEQIQNLHLLTDLVHSEGSGTFREMLSSFTDNCGICQIVLNRLNELSGSRK